MMRWIAPLALLALLLAPSASAATETYPQPVFYPCFARVDGVPYNHGNVPCPGTQGERFDYPATRVTDVDFRMRDVTGVQAVGGPSGDGAPVRWRLTADPAVGNTIFVERTSFVPNGGVLVVHVDFAGNEFTGDLTLQIWPGRNVATAWGVDVEIAVTYTG